MWKFNFDWKVTCLTRERNTDVREKYRWLKEMQMGLPLQDRSTVIQKIEWSRDKTSEVSLLSWLFACLSQKKIKFKQVSSAAYCMSVLSKIVNCSNLWGEGGKGIKSSQVGGCLVSLMGCTQLSRKEWNWIWMNMAITRACITKSTKGYCPHVHG